MSRLARGGDYAHDGVFLVDVGARALFHGSEPLAITARVFDTLVLLLERAGAVVEREEFFRRVWRDTAVEDGNLTQAIFVLRKLLGDPDQRIIVTLPGRGYMSTAPVDTIQAAEQESPAAPVSSTIAHRRGWRFLNIPLIPAVVLGGTLLAVAAFFCLDETYAHAFFRAVGALRYTRAWAEAPKKPNAEAGVLRFLFCVRGPTRAEQPSLQIPAGLLMYPMTPVLPKSTFSPSPCRRRPLIPSQDPRCWFPEKGGAGRDGGLTAENCSTTLQTAG